MTYQELAAKLDGREYGYGYITKEDINLANNNGLVIVYTHSDDTILFDGAFADDVDCCNSETTIRLDETGIPQNDCNDEDCPYFERIVENCKHKIDVIPPGESHWKLTPNFPHATFKIMEDGKIYGHGLVFEISALKG